jgi:tetratricopeptide (TPR) repeat protein
VAIRGSLKEASLPDVLQLLALGQKTGRLTVSDRQNLGHVFFERGRITDAAVVNRRDRLGDILVKSHTITQAQLEAAIEEQARTRDKRLGQILVEQGSLSRKDLEHFVRVQIEEAVYYLFTWTTGNFQFESEVRPDRHDFTISINPESLLLEGARRVDEWSLIEKKIPTLDVIFRVDRERIDGSDVTLTPEQERVLPLIDGARDVIQIGEESGMGEFDVGKALYGLLTAGFLHPTGRSKPPPPDAVSDTRLAEHRNLGVAFYKAGMLDESAREFRQVVELRPEDGAAWFHLGLVVLKQARWSEAAELLKRAVEQEGNKPSILYNLALSYEKADRLEEAESVYAEAASKARHDPRILTGWGIVALRRGDCEVAAGRLDRAREVARDRQLSELWYWARSLAAAGVERYEEAEELLRDAIALYPGQVVLQNNLAVLLEVRGDQEQAQQILDRAVEQDPSLPQLSKNLGDLLYRRGRFSEAWEAYQRAVRLDARLGDDVYFRLGNIAYKQHDHEGAAGFWQVVLELNPQHELARANLDTMRALK